MNKLAKKWIFTVFWVASSLILVFVADFSARQGLVLGLLMALLASWADGSAFTTARRFSPYYVWVSPNWNVLLSDFKLVSTPEEWRAIQEFLEQPSTEFRIMRDGIFFTVVQESEDFEHTLIYLNQQQSFIGEVSFREDLSPIRFSRKENARSSDYRAEFFMKPGGPPGVAGYNLGIRVPHWWWEEIKGSCPSPVEEDIDYPTGYVELVLAAVSFREFLLYWEPAEWSYKYYSKTASRIRELRDEDRRKLGWTALEHPDAPELAIRWPESIEHKYFHIEHRDV